MLNVKHHGEKSRNVENGRKISNARLFLLMRESLNLGVKDCVEMYGNLYVFLISDFHAN